MTYPDLLAELDRVRAYQRRVAAAIEAKNQEIGRIDSGHGTVHQPADHRVAWRPFVGERQRGTGRDVSVHADAEASNS